MPNILRCRFVLLLGLLVLCGMSGGIAAESTSRWLVSPELLKAGNLEILWQNKLPIRKTETLERLFLLGNRIYALSDSNYIVCLNREKGNPVFSRPFTHPGFPVVGLELYKDELFSIIGNKLVEINPDFGAELSARRLTVIATCPAARNGSYFYVAGSDRRMHTLQAEDKVQVFEVAADNDSMITSIVADENFVVFATDRGNVISILADKPKRLWQFKAADGIVEPIVRDVGSLFVSSEDTNVYKVNILTGRLVWKYQTGAILERGPRVGEKVVYQYVHTKGLTAIDKENGRFIWQLTEGVDLLAEVQGKAYVITNAGTLVVMDNNKAKQLYSVNFAGVSRYVANMSDSKIYIADKSGRIACLKPAE